MQWSVQALQLRQDRDTLINHLEQKLEQLRVQRHKLQKSSAAQRGNDYLQSSVHYDGQTTSTTNSYLPQTTSSKALSQNNNRPNSAFFGQTKSYNQVIQENRGRLAELEQVYKMKKQLQAQQKNARESQSRLRKTGTMDPALLDSKYQVIKQELQRVQEIIQKNKLKKAIATKTRFASSSKQSASGANNGISQTKSKASQIASSHQSSLSQQRTTTAEPSVIIISKLKNGGVEQEEALEFMFKMMKPVDSETTGFENVSQYFKVHPKIAKYFGFDTVADLDKKLKTYQTKFKGVMSYMELADFLKMQRLHSSQQPSKDKSKTKPQKLHPQPNVFVRVVKQPVNMQLLAELHKIFRKLDAKREKLVKRTSLTEALRRRAVLHKYSKPDQFTLVDFGMYLQTRVEQEQDYYQKLAKQYLTLDEVTRQWAQFAENYQVRTEEIPNPVTIQNLVKAVVIQDQPISLNQLEETQIYQKQPQYPEVEFQEIPLMPPPLEVQDDAQQVVTRPNIQAFDQYYTELAKANQIVAQHTPLQDQIEGIQKLQDYIKHMDFQMRKAEHNRHYSKQVAIPMQKTRPTTVAPKVKVLTTCQKNKKAYKTMTSSQKCWDKFLSK